MTTAAGKAAVNGADKAAAKPVEKRRALGRGLESLLPGPRVVAPSSTEYQVPSTEPAGRTGASAPTSADTRARVPAPYEPVPQESKAHEPVIEIRAVVDEEFPPDASGVEQQVPFDASSLRSELLRAGSHRSFASVRNDIGDSARADTVEMGENSGFEPGGSGTEASAPQEQEFDAAELRSAGQAGAAVPTSTIEIQAMAEEPVRGTSIRQLSLDCIEENPFQTRYLFDKDALQDLANSIRENGVLQPIVVRPGEKEGRYILILGDRRLNASKLAKKETIPAIVRKVSPQQAAEMTLIENLQREDLNCIEQAEAFRVLSKEFDMTQEEIGKRVGLSRESVSNYMRLLRLPEKVMEYLATNRLSFSEARELLRLEDVTKIEEVAEVVVGKHMSIEAVEMLVAKYNGWPDAQDPVKKLPMGGPRWQDPNVRAAQRELEQILRVRVRINDRKGRGKIVIEYHTVDDYERVLGMLKGRD
jgi:ParB family transcriptional regulator, chromosome partitioning protein